MHIPDQCETVISFCMCIRLDVTCALQNCFHNNESVMCTKVDGIIKYLKYKC